MKESTVVNEDPCGEIRRDFLLFSVFLRSLVKMYKKVVDIDYIFDYN